MYADSINNSQFYQKELYSVRAEPVKEGLATLPNVGWLQIAEYLQREVRKIWVSARLGMALAYHQSSDITIECGANIREQTV